MTPSKALAGKESEVRNVLARFGLGNPRLFGSAARGNDHSASDLDFLVEAPAGTSLFDLAAAEFELEKLLGCKVEVLTEGFLAPDVRSRISSQIVPL